MTIRQLRPDEAYTFHAFRLEGLRLCPQAFGATLEEESRFTEAEVEAQFFGGPDDFVLGAFKDGGELVGVVGLQRQARLKRRHSAHVWGLFVAPGTRRTGVARALLDELIDRALTIEGLDQLDLGVVVGCDAARRLYLACGFNPYGVEPRAHKQDAKLLDMEHMTLWLKR